MREDIHLPEITEGEVVRHFSLLSQLNFSIDTLYYPLGSCTMKYDPKLNDEMANLPGFCGIHPLQRDQTVQGALWILHELLGEMTGLPAVSVGFLAGAQGEFAGLLSARSP